VGLVVSPVLLVMRFLVPVVMVTVRVGRRLTMDMTRSVGSWVERMVTRPSRLSARQSIQLRKVERWSASGKLGSTLRGFFFTRDKNVHTEWVFVH